MRREFLRDGCRENQSGSSRYEGQDKRFEESSGAGGENTWTWSMKGKKEKERRRL